MLHFKDTTSAREVDMTKDPVCGMDVETKPGALQSSYEGKTYYFCSEGCKRSFEKDPKRYAKA